MNKILGFEEEEFRFLSNFTSSPVMYKEHLFPSVEIAYQAAKCHNESDFELFKKFTTHFDSGKAKRLGKQVALRKDWESIKFEIMFELLCQKFSITSLKIKLVQTKDVEIIESNRWHDNIFGDCVCSKCKDIEGKNMLGKMLMQIREMVNKGEL